MAKKKKGKNDVKNPPDKNKASRFKELVVVVVRGCCKMAGRGWLARSGEEEEVNGLGLLEGEGDRPPAAAQPSPVSLALQRPTVGSPVGGEDRLPFGGPCR